MGVVRVLGGLFLSATKVHESCSEHGIFTAEISVYCIVSVRWNYRNTFRKGNNKMSANAPIGFFLFGAKRNAKLETGEGKFFCKNEQPSSEDLANVQTNFYEPIESFREAYSGVCRGESSAKFPTNFMVRFLTVIIFGRTCSTKNFW